MAIKEEDIPYEILERAQATADMLERKLLRAVDAAESELARVLRAGEADLERLALVFVETIAKLAGTTVSSGDTSETRAAVSSDEIAMAIARAMARRARFS